MTTPNNTFDVYTAEAQQRWGDTAAYREYTQKVKSGKTGGWDSLAAGMDIIFGAFASCMQTGADPAAAESQALVKQLQDFITANCYTCTEQILSGLGQMYVADERFTANIDKHAPGTAAFVSAAIAHYCKT